ncbi:MAG: SDR family NAD(P)-dependent oxidoreductase, partial [Myxococcales bacterium]
RLQGEAAIVTGASRGIGRACALALGREGAAVALIGRDRDALAAVADELASLGSRSLVLAGDVRELPFVSHAWESAEAQLGPVSMLVNNAGVVEIAPVAELAADAWRRTLDTNLTAPFYFAREAVRRMVPRRKGRIVSVSSISANMGTPRLSAYNASKWGLEGFIKALAEELRGTGVLSLGVSPGSVDTDMLRKSGFPPAMTPEDVAVVVRFLLTEAPPAMQGSIVEMFG